MKLEEIKELMKAMEENNLTGFEYNEGNIHLTLTRGQAGVQMMSAPVPGSAASTASVCGAEANGSAVQTAGTQAGAAPAAAASSEGSAPADIASDKVISSPLVGTFYAASAPDKDPFVKVGDTVKKGQVLGIIEAMKLMNEIESEYDGVIEAILVNNEEVVEYGQPLFRIR